MASIPGVVLSKLARQAEAKLRFEGSDPQGGAGWRSMSTDSLARWLFDQRPPGSQYTYIQYRNIARNVIRNARDAATMQANPELTIINLLQSPGIGPNFPEFEYRTVVVGYNSDGKEVFSTLHYIYSATELSGNDVIQQAQANFSEQLAPPGFVQSIPNPEQQIVSMQVFIVSAGKR